MNVFYTLLFIVYFSTVGFSQNDFRGVRWGMSVDSVKIMESAPLTEESKKYTGNKGGITYYDGIELFYDNITVANRPANLSYQFINGKLVKIRVVFVKSMWYSYTDSISAIIRGFPDLFDALNRKGFIITDPLQCSNHEYHGPDIKNEDNWKIKRMKNWNINPQILLLVEKMIREKKYRVAFFRFENQRSRGIVTFATVYETYRDKFPITLELTPSLKVEEMIKRSDF